MENPQTGPRTSAGKQTSSQNSIRHGCTSTATLILPTESSEDFRALEATWLTDFAPQDGIEIELLHQVITADWLLRRSTRTLVELEAQIFAAEPNPLLWTPDHHAALARFQRYRTANQNAFTKHRRALEDYRRQRNAEVHQDARLTIAQTRLTIYEKKNPPKPTFEESLELMRRQAIALGFPIPNPNGTL